MTIDSKNVSYTASHLSNCLLKKIGVNYSDYCNFLKALKTKNITDIKNFVSLFLKTLSLNIGAKNMDFDICVQFIKNLHDFLLNLDLIKNIIWIDTIKSMNNFLLSIKSDNKTENNDLKPLQELKLLFYEKNYFNRFIDSIIRILYVPIGIVIIFLSPLLFISSIISIPYLGYCLIFQDCYKNEINKKNRKFFPIIPIVPVSIFFWAIFISIFVFYGLEFSQTYIVLGILGNLLILSVPIWLIKPRGIYKKPNIYDDSRVKLYYYNKVMIHKSMILSFGYFIYSIIIYIIPFIIYTISPTNFHSTFAFIASALAGVIASVFLISFAASFMDNYKRKEIGLEGNLKLNSFYTIQNYKFKLLFFTSFVIISSLFIFGSYICFHPKFNLIEWIGIGITVIFLLLLYYIKRKNFEKDLDTLRQNPPKGVYDESNPKK